MNVINLTPHIIDVLVDGQWFKFDPSGTIARVSEKSEVKGYVLDIPIITKTFGQVEGLPDPKRQTVYIVSGLVRMALPSRKDIFSPGDQVRDENGKIIGVTNLVSN